MSKLHEVLAVESAAKKTAQALMRESVATFKNKENLFAGAHRHLEMFEEADKVQNTDDVNQLDSTVDENLNYIIPHISNYINVGLAKDKTNQVARADITVGGRLIAADIPATTLLGLETKLADIRDVYAMIPTLEPSIRWEEDVNERDGVYRATHEVQTFKTKKDLEFRVAYDATPQHPAQIRELENTVNTGMYTTTRQSGKLSAKDKARRLENIDRLIRAVKEARMRANCAETVQGDLGDPIFDFING